MGETTVSATINESTKTSERHPKKETEENGRDDSDVTNAPTSGGDRDQEELSNPLESPDWVTASPRRRDKRGKRPREKSASRKGHSPSPNTRQKKK